MKALLWILVVWGVLSAGWTLLHRPWREDACWDCILMKSHRHGSRERSSSGSLKTLASAQADYRANDRDGDGKQDFWRGDVAGLYGLIPAGTTDRIKLIELSVAGADAKPTTDVIAYTTRAPKAGYWYRAVRHADEDPAKLDPNRFAFTAYPVDLSQHKWMYAIDENNTIFRAPAVKGGIDVLPDLAAPKNGWSKLD